jgi:hypothetical protein
VGIRIGGKTILGAAWPTRRRTRKTWRTFDTQRRSVIAFDSDWGRRAQFLAETQSDPASTVHPEQPLFHNRSTGLNR